MNLFLDDIRMPRQATKVKLPLVEWTIVRNYEEFVRAVKTRGVPTRVSLDHDLGPEHYVHDWAGNNIKPEQLTGYDCAKWLVNYCIEKGERFPEYYVHSMNPIGTANIHSYIRSAMEAIGEAVQAKEKVANLKK